MTLAKALRILRSQRTVCAFHEQLQLQRSGLTREPLFQAVDGQSERRPTKIRLTQSRGPGSLQVRVLDTRPDGFHHTSNSRDTLSLAPSHETRTRRSLDALSERSYGNRWD